MTTKDDLEMDQVVEEAAKTRRILEGEYLAVDKATTSKLD